MRRALKHGPHGGNSSVACVPWLARLRIGQAAPDAVPCCCPAERTSFSAFGVFDGHGGRQVATFASNSLLKAVMAEVDSSPVPLQVGGLAAPGAQLCLPADTMLCGSALHVGGSALHLGFALKLGTADQGRAVPPLTPTAFPLPPCLCRRCQRWRG